MQFRLFYQWFCSVSFFKYKCRHWFHASAFSAVAESPLKYLPSRSDSYYQVTRLWIFIERPHNTAKITSFARRVASVTFASKAEDKATGEHDRKAVFTFYGLCSIIITFHTQFYGEYVQLYESATNK